MTKTDLITKDSETGLTVSDLKDLGIEDFTLNKDDLMHLIETSVKENLAVSLIGCIRRLDVANRNARKACLDAYMVQGRKSGYFDAVREATGQDSFTLHANDHPYAKRFYARTRIEYSVPDVEEVLLWLHTSYADFNHLSDEFGRKIDYVTVQYADGDWTCREHSDAPLPAPKEESTSYGSRMFQTPFGFFGCHHLGPERLTLEQERALEQMAKAEEVLMGARRKKSDDSDDTLPEETEEMSVDVGMSSVKVRMKRTVVSNQGLRQIRKEDSEFTIKDPDMYDVIKGVNLEGETRAMSDIITDINKVCKKLRNVSHVMDRSRSAMLKSLISANSDDRAEKLTFLIRSLAQKPINVLETDK